MRAGATAVVEGTHSWASSGGGAVPGGTFYSYQRSWSILLAAYTLAGC